MLAIGIVREQNGYGQILGREMVLQNMGAEDILVLTLENMIR